MARHVVPTVGEELRYQERPHRVPSLFKTARRWLRFGLVSPKKAVSTCRAVFWGSENIRWTASCAR